MTRPLRLLALSMLAMLLASGSEALAQAHHPGGGGGGGGGRPPGPPPPGQTRERHAIPELDPSAVGAIGVVVAGGALLIARRRKR